MRADSYPDGNVEPPTERSPRATWRGIGWTVAATAGLLFVLNAGAGMYLGRARADFTYWLVREKWRMLDALEEPVDWLVLGDSGGAHGVDPQTLQQRLGGRALNLCTVVHYLLPGDVWMLERYIERFGPPRGVVIVHSYDMWRYPEVPLSMLAHVPPARWQYSSVQPNAAAGARNQAKLWMRRNFPLVSQHRALSRALRVTRTAVSYGGLSRGGQLIDVQANPESVRSHYAEHVERLRDNLTFRLAPENERALEQLAAIADAHDVPIFLASSPQYEGLAQLAEYRAYVARIASALTVFAERHPNLHVILPRPVSFPADQMQNVDHVVGDAARRYTRALAREIDATQLRAGPAIQHSQSGGRP